MKTRLIVILVVFVIINLIFYMSVLKAQKIQQKEKTIEQEGTDN